MKNILSFILFFAFFTTVRAQSITDSVILRNMINQWIVPNGNISAYKLNSLLNGVMNVQQRGDSTVLAAARKMPGAAAGDKKDDNPGPPRVDIKKDDPGNKPVVDAQVSRFQDRPDIEPELRPLHQRAE